MVSYAQFIPTSTFFKEEPNVTTLAFPNYPPSFILRRRANWLVLVITYASLYMGRYNLSIANKQITDTYGWSTTQIGTLLSFASLFYGLAAMFNGPIVDKFGGRVGMLVGASGACVFNIAFGLGAYLGFVDTKTTLFLYLTSVWVLNMYFQSFGALSIIKINAHWYHVKERGRFSAIFGSMIQLGRAAIYAMAAIPIVMDWPWQFKFFIPSVAILLMTIASYLVVQDSPATSGQGELETDDVSKGDTQKVTFGLVLKKVLTHPVTITITIAEMCTGVMRKGFEDWFPRYMQEAQHMALDNPVFTKGSFLIVMSGVAGAFAAGYLSDLLAKHRRPPIAAFGYLLVVLSLTAVALFSTNLPVVIVAFVTNSFGISIVHSMLSGTASMDFGGRKAAATATGFFDGMQYVGGSVAGYGIGRLIKGGDWTFWAPSMIGFAVAGGLLMLLIWNARPDRKTKNLWQLSIFGHWEKDKSAS
ncbi:MAG: Glycerol-3-phosphate transporter [Candidatus Uhrbacteria bacterium GW2011_GWE2_46_68]|uniref:Glycerol-3-phosphate transporter n=2 Tax=Candidatus Uhriibacteriota TaxID=1752732 RepID=A0A0G1Q8D1_9BACT|nr:MAG: Glycerol-3-phosphate transporter [Candidatus Uhrbacteria bacterium GW2011_GWF2_46_218]KKU41249.1 MAG: Glycerol-3-phosphate transporter [Candidatus Uhrbacteria bacterium GW2011_GWE2_46_68]